MMLAPSTTQLLIRQLNAFVAFMGDAGLWRVVAIEYRGIELHAVLEPQHYCPDPLFRAHLAQRIGHQAKVAAAAGKLIFLPSAQPGGGGKDAFYYTGGPIIEHLEVQR